MEYNGKALADLTDPKDPTKVIRKKASSWPASRSCGRRQHRLRLLDLCRRLDRGRQPDGRRDNSDPTGIGQTLNWAWAWPANRRVLYNRASCDPKGKPLGSNPQADCVERHGLGGATCRTSRPTSRRKTAWARSS
jgi:formate dehydrogenase major subunit